MKKGFTLVEVVVSIAVTAILFLAILTALNMISNYQLKTENKWKAHKLVENIHAEYLADPHKFEVGIETLYFNDYLEYSSEDNYAFKIDYNLTSIDDVYHLYVNDIHYKTTNLNLEFDLGRWIKP